MNDSFLVRGRQGFCDLPRDFHGLIRGDRTARNPFRECFAFDEFENQEVRVAVFLKIMDCGDVGMIERRKNLRFPLKSCDTIGVSRMILRQYFDRDIPSELGVARSIHLAHSAFAERLENLIGAEMGSRREGHVTARIIASPSGKSGMVSFMGKVLDDRKFLCKFAGVIAPPGQEGWPHQEKDALATLWPDGVVAQYQKDLLKLNHHPVRSIKRSFAIFFLMSRPPLLARRGNRSPSISDRGSFGRALRRPPVRRLNGLPVVTE